MVLQLLLCRGVWQFNHSLQEASAVAAAPPGIDVSLAVAASRISRELGSEEDVLEARNQRL